MNLAFTAFTSLLALAASALAAPPNIVLVMADDQGWGDMAYNGHPLVKTPNFDAAAATGLRFDRFYAAAPVCSPTRASVMTGRHPNRMGCFQWGNTLRPQEITLAEALKTAGYTTAHFGKWHLGCVRKGSPVSPGGSGFDEWLSAPNYYDNDPILSHRGTAEAFTGESSAIAADAAITWMKQQVEAKKPFLSVVWFGSPHAPHKAAAEDRALYPGQPDAQFLGEITGMDRAFGRIRDSLTELGIRENTILWYCSDNGALPKVGRAGDFRGHKGQIYEGGLLVPGILEWPARIPQPRATSTRANTCDIYPTLLEICGVTMPDQPPLDGVSLVKVIDGGNGPRAKAMGFWDFGTSGSGVNAKELMAAMLTAQKAGNELPPDPRSVNAGKITKTYQSDDWFGHAAWLDGDWKLHRIVEKKTGIVTWELYDLKTDPAEKQNVTASHVDKVVAYQAALEAWMESVTASLNGADYR